MTVGQLPVIVKSVPWRTWVVGYLLWLIAFTVVEGTGRQVCRMPMQKWIDAAASPRDRDARVWFRDRAHECLRVTRWYSWSVAGLFVFGVIAPLAVIWIVMRPSDVRTAVTASVFVFAVSLAVTLGTVVAVRWAYDHLG
ncbi:MAG TPA: hypothetical protein VFZ98_13265 [Vicinamibacterales bacterium]